MIPVSKDVVRFDSQKINERQDWIGRSLYGCSISRNKVHFLQHCKESSYMRVGFLQFVCRDGVVYQECDRDEMCGGDLDCSYRGLDFRNDVL